MNLRKAALAGLLALAAVVLAAPSMASANWLHNHEPITESEEINFHGELGFGNAQSGFVCEFEGTILATPESTTGHLVEFTMFDHEACESVGLFAACEIAEHPTIRNSSSGLPVDEDPLPVHIEGQHLTLTDLTTDTEYTHPVVGGCRVQIGPETFIPITGHTMHYDEVTLFDADDEDQATVTNLGVEGNAEITLYNSTAAQEANVPFAVAGLTINSEASGLTLTSEDTWGWAGAE